MHSSPFKIPSLLGTDIVKVKNRIAPELMSDPLQLNKPYNLRNTSILNRKWTITVYDGNETLFSYVPNIWNIFQIL